MLNKYKVIAPTIHQFIIYTNVDTSSTVFLRDLDVCCCVDSGEFRTRTLIQRWSLLYIVKDNAVPG